MIGRVIGFLLTAALVCGAPARAAEANPGAISASDLVRDRTGIKVPWSRSSTGRLEMDSLVTPQGELSEDHAVRVALWNNRELSAAFEEIGIARADYRQAVLPKNPTLDGEIRFGSGGRRPGGVGVMQDLSSILFLPLRKRVAAEGVQRAALTAAHDALQLVAETRTAYYAYQAADESRRLFERVSLASRVQADLAKRQHEAGNISDLDLENEQAQYELAKVALARGEVEVTSARERLNRAMGLWGKATSWTVTAELRAVPDTSDVALEGGESTAVAQRLDLAAARAEVRMTERSTTLARYSQWPDLRAGVHLEWEPEGGHTFGPAVEVAIPLFDRGQAGVARARAQLRQAEDRRAALAVSVRSEARLASGRLVSAQQLAAYYKTVVVPRRKRIAQQTKLQFNSMLVGLPQLIESNRGELNAQREYIEAVRDYWTARAELERVLAGPVRTTP